MWYTNIYTGKILKHIKIKKQKTDSRGKEGPSISDRLVSHFPVLHTVTANHSHTLPPTPCRRSGNFLITRWRDVGVLR